MMIETIRLSHMPIDQPLFATLYENVENTNFLKEQLLAGNSDFEYAFVDASMIVSRRHALAAAFRAMNDNLHGRLKSRNIHSEIVFALSSNNNIGEAFRRFGIGDSTKHLLVFKVATTPEITVDGVAGHLAEHIKGSEVIFDDENIGRMTDVPRVRKVYKLTLTNTKPSGKTADEAMQQRERSDLETQIFGLMALRGAT